jgi:hypothetical protein
MCGGGDDEIYTRAILFDPNRGGRSQYRVQQARMETN